jgi:hypothetical protein
MNYVRVLLKGEAVDCNPTLCRFESCHVLQILKEKYHGLEYQQQAK